MKHKIKPMKYLWTFLGFQGFFLMIFYLPISFFLWDFDITLLRLIAVMAYLCWLWFLGWVYFEKE